MDLDLALIERLPSRRPLVIFNLVDAIDGDGRLAPSVPARLDALGTAYTGCSTSALSATLSKVGTKRKLAHAGLPTPEWSADGTGLDPDVRVIVKAVWEHGSLGLDETSVMRCADAPQIVAARTKHLKTEHFVEAYVEGREFHVALLERMSGVEVLPIIEVLFEGVGACEPKIYGYDGKWTPDSAAYIGTVRRFGLEQDEPRIGHYAQAVRADLLDAVRIQWLCARRFSCRSDRRPLHHRRKSKPVSFPGCRRRCRCRAGWILLLRLDRQYCRELAWILARQRWTCFALKNCIGPLLDHARVFIR